jgi:hypothetical protein
MNKNVITLYNIKRFTSQCFDKDNDKVASIIKGILDSKSPRISDISSKKVSILSSDREQEINSR